MDMILEKCPGTIGRTDDVVIDGQTKKDHDQNFHTLMKVTRRGGLCFQSANGAVDQMEIYFFGAVFTKNRLHPDSHKVNVIKSLPSPYNATLLCALGSCEGKGNHNIFGKIYPLSIWPHSTPEMVWFGFFV